MLAPSGFDCTYVILTPSELEQLQSNSLGSLTIDSQLYTDVTGYLLLSFVSGHILGRILKGLGRG
ncbi:hypothetical protein EAY03_16670 [Vibrio anguillarum]|uniref:Uncharacterized protein n=2 Tax=Vibrionaceae TaxID=641 RepID=A0A289GGA7_VIBAN|nr:hypothetical protein CK207_07670 [Vibrio anguillarum]AZS26401.1 hypothetical protein DYL72_00065 [Vibrio anguillarum]MBF4311462.1 hypothetical protein [Vibrio anguillarum]MBF4322592.1 hypothetical protein [Vibrio anguillarum]MBF4326192.1 hypothetical protein [Vibrio anguillarum]